MPILFLWALGFLVSLSAPKKIYPLCKNLALTLKKKKHKQIPSIHNKVQSECGSFEAKIHTARIWP